MTIQNIFFLLCSSIDHANREQRAKGPRKLSPLVKAKPDDRLPGRSLPTNGPFLLRLDGRPHSLLKEIAKRGKEDRSPLQFKPWSLTQGQNKQNCWSWNKTICIGKKLVHLTLEPRIMRILVYNNIK